MAYSMDLRLRALGLLDAGRSVEEVSKLLAIGTATLWRWLRRRRAGQLETRYFWKRTPYRLDEVAMLAYMEENPDAYQQEIATAMGVGKSTIQWSFKRLGITRKKRRRNTESATKRNAGPAKRI